MTGYRITLNDAVSQWPQYPGERWEEIAAHCEARGWTAKLERQHVFVFESETDSAAYISGLTNPRGFIRLKNRVACPWETLATL